MDKLFVIVLMTKLTETSFKFSPNNNTAVCSLRLQIYRIEMCTLHYFIYRKHSLTSAWDTKSLDLNNFKINLNFKKVITPFF
jgi:hypothetical protein